MNLPLRPLLALLLAGLILGGMQLYTTLRPAPQRSEIAVRFAEGRFTLEVTLTFDAGPDPFAFETENAPALLVTFEGRELLRRTEPVPAGETVRIESIEGIVSGSGRRGRNEFFVEAVPQDSAGGLSRAVRLRLLRDEQPIAEHSLWSDPGEPVRGTLVFELTEAEGGAAPAEEHAHSTAGEAGP